MTTTPLKQRMYHLVMYNISPIQQGIQSYHAGIEYALKFWDTPEFQQWASTDKTVIILNGGTSNNLGHPDKDGVVHYGSMEEHVAKLSLNNIPYACFHEPDLNNATSAIAFLCDERVWDRETYPDPVILIFKSAEYATPADRIAAQQAELQQELSKKYGAKVAFLRTYLSRLRLA